MDVQIDSPIGSELQPTIEHEVVLAQLSGDQKEFSVSIGNTLTFFLPFLRS